MILPRRKRHLAIQLRVAAQRRRNQNPPLPIDGHFLRAANEQRLESLHPRIEPRLRFQIRVERVPLTRRIQRQASLSVVREIRDIKTIMIFALQNFAKPGRNAYPPLLIDRMVKPTTKHHESSPTSHNIPLCPTTVKRIAQRTEIKLSINSNSQ